MSNLSFKVNGRKVSRASMMSALERKAFKLVRDELVRKLRNIRDPETGAPPKIKVKGQNLHDLEIEVDGSPKLIKKVRGLFN